MFRRFTAPLFAASDGRPIVWFRVTLGVLMLTELFLTNGSYADLYGPRGFLQSNLLDSVVGSSGIPVERIANRIGLDYVTLLKIFFSLQAGFLLAFTFGVYTRAAAVGAWLGQTAIMNASFLSIYGVDRYFHLFIFLSLFMPGQRSLRTETVANTYFLRACQLALLITYIHAGVSKMGGSDWWTGDAIWRALNVPEFSQRSFLWLADMPWLAKLACWGTLLIETGYVVAVCFRRLRVPWVLAIISLHVGIALFMGLWLFAISLILLNAVLFLGPELSAQKMKKPVGIADRLFKTTSVTAY